MRTLLLNFSIIVLLFIGNSCNTVNSKEQVEKTSVVENDKVEVYYFHYTRRCATCLAVEDVTKEALEEYYPEHLENSVIIFKSVNLDEPDSEELAEQLEISGQSLLIVATNVKENITTEAFMNAKSNPEKLKQLIKTTIDPIIKE